MAPFDQAGPSRLEARRNALQDPEDTVRVEVGVLAGDLELSGGQDDIGQHAVGD